MAYIQKRVTADGRTRYRVQIRKKGYPTQTATFERLTDARKWARDTEADIDHGRHFKTVAAKKHTFAELIDRYIEDVLPTKGRQRKNQLYQLRWWKPQLGPYTLADVTPDKIAECRGKLAKGVTHYDRKRGPATVCRYLAALSHAYTVARKEWRWVTENPVQEITKPREPRGRVRFLSDDERARLLDACRESSNPCLYTVVVLALSTGMRKGEIMNMTWDDVDLANGRMTLHETKNDERRVVPLVSRALEALKEHAKVRRLDTTFLFPAKPNVQKVQKPMDIRDAWKTALKNADIADFRFHDLRHSAASYLAMNGASLAEIAEVLGHKTLQMVKRYAHLSEAHTAGVVARMNERIFGQ